MSDATNDYQLLDSGNMKKLERLGSYLLVRPSPAAVWEPHLPESEWRKADGVYTRDTGEDNGKWTFYRKVQREFDVLYGSLHFHIRLTNFGHMGLFAEQIDNWAWLQASVLPPV